ncbi:hypothetical protein [Algibacter sp. 2305UL17-15]|uniref:hypothetical protein n=1 Tax=Algibacter sp. 2305UL17-15 TaxID=3231268 RepID=UPI0034590B72
MNTIEIIDAYNHLLERLQTDIKASNFKIQFFLDELNLKRSFFYKKLKEKRFTPDELRIISKHLYPEEFEEDKKETEIIKLLLKQSRQDYAKGKFEDFETVMKEARAKYGL